MLSNLNDIVDELIKLKNEKNISYKEIANKSNVRYHVIQRFFNKKIKDPSFDDVLRVLEIFNFNNRIVSLLLDIKIKPKNILNEYEIFKIKISNNKFLELLKIKKAKEKISLKEISKSINYDYTSISRSLNNKTLRFNMLIGIAKRSDITLLELLWSLGYIKNYPYDGITLNPESSYHTKLNNEKKYNNIIIKIEKNEDIYVLKNDYLTEEIILLYHYFLSENNKGVSNIIIEKYETENIPIIFSNKKLKFISIRSIRNKFKENRDLREKHFIFYQIINDIFRNRKMVQH